MDKIKILLILVLISISNTVLAIPNNETFMYEFEDNLNDSSNNQLTLNGSLSVLNYTIGMIGKGLD